MIRKHLTHLFLVYFFIGTGCTQNDVEAPKPLQIDEVEGSVSSGRLMRIENFPSSFVDSRTVDIWLPEMIYLREELEAMNGDKSSHEPLSVIYMHDGQMLFDSTTTWNKQEWRVDETLTALIETGQLDPVVVVAIWNNSSKRWAEYAPKFMAESQRLGQGLMDSRNHDLDDIISDSYVSFLAEELVPFIDQVLSTNTSPEGRLVMGSSMGGLISLYAHFEKPDTFGKVGAISTHWPIISPEQFKKPSDNPLYRGFAGYIEEKVRENPEVKRNIYFDLGNQTLDAYYPPYQDEVDRIMKNNASENTGWVTFFDEGAAHNEISWANRLDKAILYLMRNQKPTE